MYFTVLYFVLIGVDWFVILCMKNLQLLTGGQAYAVELALDMPESERNLNQGKIEL